MPPQTPIQAAMTLALAEAAAAASRGEVPVGAVVLDPAGQAIAAAGNRTEETCDAAGHAELLALRLAGQRLGSPRLTGCDLVVTLEPCPMCAAAIGLFRIRRLVFGAYDAKGGGVEHGPRIYQSAASQHRPEVVGGVRESEAAALMRAFFAARR